MIDANSCVNCPVFKKCFASTLRKAELENFEFMIVREQFDKGESIYRCNKAANFTYIITEGEVILEHEGTSASPIILRIARETELIGLEALIKERAYLSTAKAKGDVTVCKIGSKLLEDFAKGNNVLLNRIMSELYEEKRAFLNYSIIMNSGTPKSKLAYSLLNLSDNAGLVVATKEEMAQMARLRRETVSRILKTFKENELLELEKRVIKIVNRKALELLVAI